MDENFKYKGKLPVLLCGCFIYFLLFKRNRIIFIDGSDLRSAVLRGGKGRESGPSPLCLILNILDHKVGRGGAGGSGEGGR